MRNTAIDVFCGWGIFFSLCALIFVLPAAIAYLDSCAALAIFFYLIKKINRWDGFAPPVNFLNRPLLFLALAIFISVLFSQYPGLSLMAFVGKFLKGVFLYFCFIEAFKDQKRIRIFLFFFLASACLTALSGDIQHFTGIDFIKGNRLGYQRVNSTFFSPNGLGAYLLPVIGLVAHFLFTAIARTKSWILGGAMFFLMALLLFCLCWTYSRSSWIGYLVLLLVMGLMDWHKVLLVGSLLLIFIFIFLPSLNNARHLHLINDKSGDSSFDDTWQGGSGRFGFWKNAVSIIRSSPIVGTGLNTYTRVLMRNPDRKTWWYAHNCYLQLAAETGLLGLVCFLWMLYVLLGHGLIYCKQISDPWALACLQGTVAGLSGFLVQSFFDNTFYTVQLGVLMWMMFGLMAALTQNGSQNEITRGLWDQ